MAEKRRLGDSGLEIVPLVLGGNVFGWTADRRESFRILDTFVDSGGTMIDTADVYSFWVEGHSGGESESVIGEWLRLDPAKRHKVQVATKGGFNDGLGASALEAACEASLRRLGVDTIDLYYAHRDDASVPLAESLGQFESLRRQGKIREIGLSQFSPERIVEAAALADREGYRRPCALQTWYNLIDREKLEGPLRDAAVASGLGVIPFYALANGFLTGKYRQRSDLAKSVRGDRVEGYLQGRGARVLEAMDSVAAETGAALGAIAIAWTLAQPAIAGALASATSVAQLGESLAALTLELTPSQLARLDEASST